MRSFARIALATSVTLALVGCGGAAQQQDAATDDNQAEGTEQVEEQTEDASTETPKSGGWQVNGDITGTTLTEEQLKVFQKATAELDGVDYEPVAVIGQQVVAGMNYAYLCKATVVAPDAKPTWDVVVVYADLEGNATFTSANEIDLADLKVTDESTTEATGAWAVPEPTDGVSLPGNADDAFDAAIADIDLWRRPGIVNDAKKQLSSELANYCFIDTNAEGLTTAHEPWHLPDIAHYDSSSEVKLGKLFAQAVIDSL